MKDNQEIIGLYGIFFKRLEELKEQCKKDIIPFPILFKRLCGSFRITKKECWSVLFLLRDIGFIEVVPFHGIKISKNLE